MPELVVNISQQLKSVAYPGYFFGGGGWFNKFSGRQRAQRERGSGAGGPLVSGVPLNLQMCETHILISLVQTYFPLNREFGSALTKTLEFRGRFEPPQKPATLLGMPPIELVHTHGTVT
jgi:hypothetical protein